MIVCGCGDGVCVCVCVCEGREGGGMLSASGHGWVYCRPHE